MTNSSPTISPSSVAGWPSVPTNDPPAGVAVRWIDAGGVRFRCLVGSGVGRPLLLLHGWPTWAEVWLPLVQRLNLGRPWFAPDLPCQGRSSLVPRAERNLTSYRKAVAAFADAMDLSGVDVIGNSMGGSLAVMLGVDRPDRVAKVATIDCAGFQAKFPGRTSRLYLPFLLPCLFRSPGTGSARKLLTRAIFHDPAQVSEAWVTAFVEGWRPRDRCKGYLDTAFALRHPDASVLDTARSLRAPLMVVCGRDDVQFSWQAQEGFAKSIPGARFAAIDSAGHFPMVERSAATAQALLPFLGD
jgi:pimeloyl-ACP methyl ester carboxylesterase